MASFGEDLKRERELRDISLEEIAQATNISKSFLEALEQNSFDTLPGGAYIRGFIRSYALHVGIDVEETLDAYMVEVDRAQAEAEGSPVAAALRTHSPQAGKAAEVVVIGAMVMATLVVGLAYLTGNTDGATALPADPEAHGAALRARFKKAGSLPSLPGLPGLPDEKGPEGPVRAQTGGPAPPAEPAPEVIVRIRARETTGIQLSCSGRIQFDGELWVGAERHFPCRAPIFVSAGNGGAIDYSVGEEDLRPLGRSGERVQRREIGNAGRESPDQG